jgi:hypothetical protein
LDAVREYYRLVTVIQLYNKGVADEGERKRKKGELRDSFIFIDFVMS